MTAHRRTMTRRLDQAAWLLAEMAHRRDHWAVVRHPFCRRWTAGELSRAELQAYADQHHSVPVALAGAARRAADLAEGMLREELTRHAAERERDVERWCAFGLATGWSPADAWCFGADPLPESEAGERCWIGDADRSLAEHLVTVHALESAQADAARPQLNALLGDYAFADRSTRYFELRLLGDDGPAGLLEAALTGALPVSDPFTLLHHAERVYRSYWELLDGIDRACARPSEPGPRAASR